MQNQEQERRRHKDELRRKEDSAFEDAWREVKQRIEAKARSEAEDYIHTSEGRRRLQHDADIAFDEPVSEVQAKLELGLANVEGGRWQLIARQRPDGLGPVV
jgi:hypothetical protein